MSRGGDDRGELERSVAEASDYITAHADDGADPLVAGRLVNAHYKRARALKLLGRHRESLADWDSVLHEWGVEQPDPAGPRRVRLVAALALKSESLHLIGRRREAMLLEEEIADRFDDDLDEAIRWFVTMARLRRAQKLLREPAGLEQALLVSDALLAHVRLTPEPLLSAAAEVLVSHARHLSTTRGPGGLELVAALGELVTNLGLEAVDAVLPAIEARLGLPGPLTGLRRHLAPAGLEQHRRRAEQALRVLDTLLLVVGERDEGRLAALKVQAEYLRVQAIAQAGRPVSGLRRMWGLWEARDPATVQALSEMADQAAGAGHWLGQLNAVTLLSRRAISLVGEDPHLARLAYDDSITERLGERLPPVVHLAVRLFRPEAPRSR